MSHLRERDEKNCLNCNAQLYGKHCHVCGQENIPSKDSVWHLISHFFNDITHFDGKFFHTLGLLIWRPGFLTSEYGRGRRASYLNPVRMYIFTSFVFFLIFFTVFHVSEEAPQIKDATFNKKTLAEIAKMDSASFANFTKGLNIELGRPDKPVSRAEFKNYTDSISKTGFAFAGFRYRSKAEYDSLLKAGTIKHNWLTRQINYRILALNAKYNNDSQRILAALKSSVLHSMPQLLFVSLPLLALLLKLFYVRRHRFFYVDHVIFSLHLYIFVFIALLFLFSLDALNENLHWGVINFIAGLMYFVLFFYQLKAMRNFYQQGWGKSILKFFLLNITFFVVIMLLFVIFGLLSFLKI